jgi:hypothetical protein
LGAISYDIVIEIVYILDPTRRVAPLTAVPKDDLKSSIWRRKKSSSEKGRASGAQVRLSVKSFKKNRMKKARHGPGGPWDLI